MGTYLGNLDPSTDQAYTEAAVAALRGGINFIDTSLNYRHQRSERSLGAAFRKLLEAGEVARDEFVVCTKAGYLVPGAIPAGKLADEDIVSGVHAMAPAFLADQLGRSRENLGLETIDVFYLHNPESQFEAAGADEVYRRIGQAFEELEKQAEAGRIRFYGTATWTGLRTRDASAEGLSVVRLAGIAHGIAGDNHRFRFIQLPFNLAMTEGAATEREPWNGGRATTFEAAAKLGITVAASASMLQGRLSRDLPPQVAAALPGLATDGQRAIQFARSAAGVTTALVGMSRAAHVVENLRVAVAAPSDLSAWFRPRR
jgi:aryl-alcohol dehydrogenase-like predicted oxidoreductase